MTIALIIWIKGIPTLRCNPWIGELIAIMVLTGKVWSCQRSASKFSIKFHLKPKDESSLR